MGVNVVELTRRLSLVEQFLQIETLLADVDASLSSGCYSDVIDKLDIIQLILLSVNAELDLEGGIVKILRTELRIARERLLYDLGEQWNRMVHWTLPIDHRRQHKNCQSCSD
jgi:Centromere/kinetochore Zw10